MADLQVKVGLDRSGFQTGLAAMENAVQGFGGKLSGILAGSFSFAAIGAGISRAIDQGDQLQDLANRFGVAASSLQEIGNAASLSGASLEDVASAMNKLAKNAGEAVGGNEAMQESFKKIGLSVSDLAGMTPQDLFYALSKSVASGVLGMQDFAVAQDLAGKGAASLMETLRMGPEAIQANGKAMGVWSDETIAALGAASDAIKAFQNKITIGLGSLVPVLNKAIERYQDLIESAYLYIRANRDENLDDKGRQELYGMAAGKFKDAVSGRVNVEAQVTKAVIRETEARIAASDKEAAAKEASAERWKRATESMQEVDNREEITNSRIETRAMIRQAERIRDRTPGSKAFEAKRDEISTQWNKVFGVKPSDEAVKKAMGPAPTPAPDPNKFSWMSAPLTDNANLSKVENKQPTASQIDSLAQEVKKAVDKLDAILRTAGTFGP